MRTQKLMYSILFALLIFFLSMFINIVPCQTAPELPNPNYTWAMCNLNPDIHVKQGIQKKYFGYTSSLLETYIIILVMFFLISMILMHFVSRKKS